MVLTGQSSKHLHEIVNVADSVPTTPFEPASPDPVRARRLSPDEQTQVIEGYQAGASMTRLANRFDVRRDTISKLLRRAGVEARVQRAMDQQQVDEAVRLYDQGQSLATIGDRLGWDAQTIRCQLKQRGITMRGPHDWRR